MLSGNISNPQHMTDIARTTQGWIFGVGDMGVEDLVTEDVGVEGQA